MYRGTIGHSCARRHRCEGTARSSALLRVARESWTHGSLVIGRTLNGTKSHPFDYCGAACVLLH